MDDAFAVRNGKLDPTAISKLPKLWEDAGTLQSTADCDRCLAAVDAAISSYEARHPDWLEQVSGAPQEAAAADESAGGPAGAAAAAATEAQSREVLDRLFDILCVNSHTPLQQFVLLCGLDISSLYTYEDDGVQALQERAFSPGGLSVEEVYQQWASLVVVMGMLCASVGDVNSEEVGLWLVG